MLGRTRLLNAIVAMQMHEETEMLGGLNIPNLEDTTDAICTCGSELAHHRSIYS
jgi:hypothetical protein